MTRMVQCVKLGKELPGLKFAPLPNALGQKIFDNVSQEAWNGWLSYQTMLINENHLSMIDPEAKKFITEPRNKFLDNEDYERPKGWTAQK